MLKNTSKISQSSDGNSNVSDMFASVYSMNSASNMADILTNMTTGMDIHKIDLDRLKEAPSEWNFYSPLSIKKMEELIYSIEKNGLLHPLVVWEQNDGTYMILSGHNRKRAFEMLYDSTKDEKYSKVFCYIKKSDEITEDEAKEIIIDTNWVQRELSTIEKAQSIYRKYTAIGRKQKVKHGEGQGIRNYDRIAEQYNISGRHVLNYYKLNYLIDEIQNMVSENRLSIKAGVKLSNFDPLMQKWMYDNFKDDINNQVVFKIQKDMSNDEIERIIIGEKEIKTVELKYTVPLELKEDFQIYIKDFYEKHNIK